MIRKNVPPKVVIIVISAVLVALGLIYNYFSQGGPRGAVARRMERASRRMPSIDPATGKLVMLEMPMNVPGAAKKAVILKLPTPEEARRRMRK